MTFLNVMFRYDGTLTGDQVRALGDSLAVYGMRGMNIDETARTIAVEYDASRLTNDGVEAMLRRCQVQVGERVDLTMVG